MALTIDQYKQLRRKGLNPAQIQELGDDQVQQALTSSLPVYGDTGEEKKSFTGFLSNIAGSAFNVGKDIVSAVTHPIETVKGLGKVALGGVQKLIPGEQGQEETFNQVAQFFDQRYGVSDVFRGDIEGAAKKILDTAYKDPTGFALDLASLLTGGGAALKAGSKVAGVTRGAELSAAAQKAINIGRAIDPFELVMKGTGAFVGKAAERVGLTPTEFNEPLMSLAREKGVDLPAASFSKSKITPQLEALTQKSLFGGNLVEKIQKAGSRLEELADNVIQTTKKSGDLAIVGREIIKGFDAFRSAFFDIKQQLYDEVRTLKAETGISSLKIVPQQTIDFLTSIIKEKKKVVGIKPSDLDFFQNLKDGLARKSNKIDNYTATLKEINKKVKDFNDPISSGNQGVLKKLGAMLSDEIDNGVTDFAKANNRPDLIEAIDAANNFYKENVKILDDSYARKIVDLKDTPEKIVDAVIKPNSESDTARVMQLVGEDAADGIRASFLEKMFNAAKSKDLAFKPEAFDNFITKYGENTIKAILTPEQYQAVQDIAELNKAFKVGEKIAEGAQTTFTAKLATQATLLFTNPILGLKLLVGDALFSKFISSPAGQEFLTKGLDVSGAVRNKLDIVTNKAGKFERFLFQGGRTRQIIPQEEE